MCRVRVTDQSTFEHSSFFSSILTFICSSRHSAAAKLMESGSLLKGYTHYPTYIPVFPCTSERSRRLESANGINRESLFEENRSCLVVFAICYSR